MAGQSYAHALRVRGSDVAESVRQFLFDGDDRHHVRVQVEPFHQRLRAMHRFEGMSPST